MGHQVMQYIEGFGCQGNRLRPTPETGVVRIEAKVGEAPLRGGHLRPPLPIENWPRPRGVKAHDTTAAVYRHGKTLSELLLKHYSIITQFLRHLYDFLPSVCHTPQCQGRSRLVIRAGDSGSASRLRGRQT